MTTAIRSFAWANTTAAEWYVWTKGVQDLLLAVGLVKTTDTGQLDFSNPPGSMPTATNNLYGYQVFRFPDADPNQTARPIFIRVNYGTDSYARPFVQFVVASGSSGAGVMSTPQFVNNDNRYSTGSVYTVGALNSYACYVDGTFTCVLAYGVLSLSFNTCLSNLVVDRARSTTGVALDKGFLVESARYLGQLPYSMQLYGPASPAMQYNVPALIPNVNAVSSADGANVNVFRHYMMTPGVYPSLGSLTYFFSEFGALSPITVPVLGTSHTYMPMGKAITQWAMNYSGFASSGDNICGMIRWE